MARCKPQNIDSTEDFVTRRFFSLTITEMICCALRIFSL